MNFNFYPSSPADGDDKAWLTIANPRVFSVAGNLLHINKQYNGVWHALVGKGLLPAAAMLESIEIVREPGTNLADVQIKGRGISMRRRAVIVMRDADQPYIQFEADLVGVITVYVTRNFMAGLVPGRIELEV